MEHRNDIDRLLKERLEQLQFPYEASHWEMLLERLRKEPGFNLQESGAWEKLRTDLSEMKLADASAASSWEQLEMRLYEEGLLEVKPDPETLLRNRLRHREEPYQPEHWAQMSQRIDEEFSIAHRLLKHKVVEVAAMLLLIISILQYLPFEGLHAGPFGKKGLAFWSAWTAWQEETKNNNLPKGEKGAPLVDTDEAGEYVLPGLSANTSHLVPLTAAVPHRPARQLQALNAATRENRHARQEVMSDYAVELNIEMAELQQEAAGPFGQTTAKGQRKKIHILPNLFGAKGSRKVASTSKKRKLATKTFNPFAGRGRVALWSAYDYNYIYSSIDPILETPAYSVAASGFSTGVNLGVGKRHWEFAFGAAYSTLAYETFTPPLQYGNMDLVVLEELRGMQYDFLQLPVRFNLYLQPDHPKWDFYTSFGLSGTFVLVANYDRHYQYYAAEKPSPSDLNAVLNQSKLKQKEFTEGILEGGPIKGNAYLFGEVGLGVERYINRRWQFFLQPTYRVHLSNRRLGPNEDFLRNFSVRMGVKARVW